MVRFWTLTHRFPPSMDCGLIFGATKHLPARSAFGARRLAISSIRTACRSTTPYIYLA